MRLLLDTNVVLWWLDDNPRLSAGARDAIGAPEAEVAVSTATLWELAIKQSIGKLTVSADLRHHIHEQAFLELPVLGDHAEVVRELPFHHKDPFDRMLVAQAHVERMTLVTADRALTAYGVPILPAS